MRKSIAVLFAAMLVCAVAVTAKEAKEEKEGAVKKGVLMNFGKGDQFSNGGFEQALCEEHMQGKEKVRAKLKGSFGVFGSSKNVDWSKYNYLVFNCFLTGDKPFTGALLVGDKESYAKWGGMNYATLNFTLKPGENKEVHLGIDGLATSARSLDMKNIQVYQFYPDFPEVFMGNIYLVYEEE
jgi:hypothetical protein